MSFSLLYELIVHTKLKLLHYALRKHNDLKYFPICTNHLHVKYEINSLLILSQLYILHQLHIKGL